MNFKAVNGLQNHERIIRMRNDKLGLLGFIAIHSTTRGPALGGCSILESHCEDEILNSAARLSAASTIKNALAGIPFGGGQAILMGPFPDGRRENIFQAFGEAIDSLDGDFIAFRKTGISSGDMIAVGVQTRHFVGSSLDPSLFIAQGVLRGMEAAALHGLNRPSLSGVRVAIDGLETVGELLCALLAAADAELVVWDPDGERVNRVCALYGATPGSADSFYLEEADILAPCAGSAGITPQVAGTLNARIIAGAADNQLASIHAGEILTARGVVHAPDCIINAGGVIAAAAELEPGQCKDHLFGRVDLIFDRTLDVLQEARRRKQPPQCVAEDLAKCILTKLHRKTP